MCLFRLVLSCFCLFGLQYLLQGQAFQKVYADPGGRYLIAHEVQEQAAGGFLISGEYRDQYAHAFILNADTNGYPLWAKIYYPPDTTFEFPAGWNVRPMSDGGALLHAQKSLNGSILGQILIKTNAFGDVAWGAFAPAILDRYSLSLQTDGCYLGGYNRPAEQLFLGKLNFAGQTLWEYQYTAGTFDLYRIFCQEPMDDKLLLAVGVEQKQPGGGSFGPDHTVMMQLDAQGNVLKKAFFPDIFIQALKALPNGDIAFLARSEGIDWVGIGVMDGNFNWKWFKELRLGGGGLLSKDLASNQLSLSGDGTLLTSIFYLGGGGSLLLRHTLDGALQTQKVYLAGLFGNALGNAGAQDFTRIANLSADRFVFSRPYLDGSLPNCPTRQACALKLVDTIFKSSPIEIKRSVFSCIRPETVLEKQFNYSVDDFCYDPGDLNAHFSMQDSVICPGEAIRVKRLQGVGRYPFGSSNWQFGSAIPATGSSAEIGIVRFDEPGTHAIWHQFQVGGCLDTAVQYLVVDTPPEIALGKDSVYCAGDLVSLEAGFNPDYQYAWNTGEALSSIVANKSGQYAVTVTDQAGCFTEEALQLTFISPQTVALDKDTLLCTGQTLQIAPIETTPGAALLWSNGQQSPSITVSESGSYTVQVQTQACVFQDTIQVDFADCPACKTYVPNVFWPDHEGINGLFQVFSDCQLGQIKMQVYDRWGNQVFSSTGATPFWDGRIQGRAALPGVYLYQAWVQLEGAAHPAQQKALQGQVTLLR